jgi:2-polyprenyl-6-methoxyphenol hydroxylase-like FAD-dependent oxidoreductase
MNDRSYDAIVVGARCAGSPTAMLLAQKGYGVLVVDRATFPSDTISTHLVHPPGVAALRRWGLLDRVVATGCPPVHTYVFDFGAFELIGAPGTADEPVGYAPRRTVLDEILVDAAAESGAEVREAFTVDAVLFEDRKRDIEGNFLSVVDMVPEFAERVRGARREERFMGMAVPGWFRRPYGPGWALVGDAGYNKDFITAQGISDAFRDAELCATALDAWLSGARPFDEAMADYQSTRDAHVLPMYGFTADLASLEPPPPELQQVLAAATGNQDVMDGFARVNAGVTSPAEYFSEENVAKILGAAARRG